MEDLDLETPIPTEIESRRRIKSHRKSRTGCWTCKARKIKCCETRPRCLNCRIRSVQCQYPEIPAMPVATRVERLQYKSNSFSMRDMRLFHNFMTASFPHLPLDCENVWLTDIPLLAQEHPFLMHGILALGASHLHSRTGLELRETVENHRMMAMRGLVASADSENKVPQESRLNAQMATAITLSFTGTSMTDSISNILIVMRGVATLAYQIQRNGYTSPFFVHTGRTDFVDDPCDDGHVSRMRYRLRDAKPLSLDFEVERGQDSLSFVANTCTFQPQEWKFLLELKSCLECLESPGDAYAHYNKLWSIFIRMSAEEFAHFTDANNATGIVLQAHFLALETMLRPYLITLRLAGRLDDFKADQTLAALPPLSKNNPQRLLEWPTQLIQEAYEKTP